jgi:hypothetical protein
MAAKHSNYRAMQYLPAIAGTRAFAATLIADQPRAH